VFRTERHPFLIEQHNTHKQHSEDVFPRLRRTHSLAPHFHRRPLRSSTRHLALTPEQTSTRLANSSSTARTSNIGSTIRSGIERAQTEAGDEAFKAGVLYTLLGVSALGAGYLIAAPKVDGRTVSQRDLL
jgi:hypothetical protein